MTRNIQNNNLQDNRIVKKFCELYSKSQSSSVTYYLSPTSKSSGVKKEHLLICYAVAGYPDIKTTKEIVSAMIESGADIIEIGLPFSDPIADGPMIQEASFIALTHGITPDKALEIVKDIRQEFPNIPIVAMTYSNILLKVGFRKFMRKAKQSGIDGFILPDMPIEESDKYVKEASRLNLATIFLVSPNTNEERIRSIASKSSGFLYLVSVFGTTGIRKSFEDSTANYVKDTKKIVGSSIPIAVGFGISNRSHAKFMINAGADAVIVASAIINIIKSYTDRKVNNKKKEEMLKEVRIFVSSMKKSLFNKFTLDHNN
jgi:tryptophan synthase alpha chain